MQLNAIEAAKAHYAGGGYGYSRPLMLEQTTYIIGPGPNGYGAAMALPKSVCAIAMNSAGAMRCWPYWICIDANSYRYPWYDNIPAGTQRIMGRHAGIKRAAYVLEPEDYPAGCGVLGAALTLCRCAGVRSVILCGCDMAGGYYDGSTPSHCGDYPHIARVQELIGCCVSDGMNVYTASPTRLDIPEWSKPCMV